MSTRSEIVYEPEVAARRLGNISVSLLLAILKANPQRYKYTSFHTDPDAKPWGRGRKAWGLSESQLAAIIDGQARTMPEARDKDQAAKPKPCTTLPGHDGRSRLKRRVKA